jgi:hypothetical protein
MQISLYSLLSTVQVTKTRYFVYGSGSEAYVEKTKIVRRNAFCKHHLERNRGREKQREIGQYSD